MKVLYLDESGDHSLVKIDPQFPVFCLAGCIFDEHEYNRNSKAQIDAFKIRYFGSTNIILHSHDIRKCISPFNILLNKAIKKSFYEDLDNLMKSLPFVIIASVVSKQRLKDSYKDPANPYMLSLEFLMERFFYYLEEHNDVGYICVESRDPKSNTDLLTTFTENINNGSWGTDRHVTAEQFQSKIQKMTFITKQQNENGHQIADLVAYPIAKFVQNHKRDNPAFQVLRSKFRARDGKIMGCGLKIFPK